VLFVSIQTFFVGGGDFLLGEFSVGIEVFGGELLREILTRGNFPEFI